MIRQVVITQELRIKSALDANGITIPFPIRTVDFGIEGGVGLGEVLGSLSGSRASRAA